MERAQRGHNEPQTAFEAMHACFEEYEGVLTGEGYLTDAPFGDGEVDDYSEHDEWYLDELSYLDAESEYPTTGEALRAAHQRHMLGPFDPLPYLDGQYIKKAIPAKLRWDVFRRDGYQCVYCGAHRDLTADHILSERRGGLTEFHNLQTLCRPCNSKKGAK